MDRGSVDIGPSSEGLDPHDAVSTVLVSLDDSSAAGGGDGSCSSMDDLPFIPCSAAELIAQASQFGHHDTARMDSRLANLGRRLARSENVTPTLSQHARFAPVFTHIQIECDKLVLCACVLNRGDKCALHKWVMDFKCLETWLGRLSFRVVNTANVENGANSLTQYLVAILHSVNVWSHVSSLGPRSQEQEAAWNRLQQAIQPTAIEIHQLEWAQKHAADVSVYATFSPDVPLSCTWCLPYVTVVFVHLFRLVQPHVLGYEIEEIQDLLSRCPMYLWPRWLRNVLDEAKVALTCTCRLQRHCIYCVLDRLCRPDNLQRARSAIADTSCKDMSDEQEIFPLQLVSLQHTIDTSGSDQVSAMLERLYLARDITGFANELDLLPNLLEWPLLPSLDDGGQVRYQCATQPFPGTRTFDQPKQMKSIVTSLLRWVLDGADAFIQQKSAKLSGSSKPASLKVANKAPSGDTHSLASLVGRALAAVSGRQDPSDARVVLVQAEATIANAIGEYNNIAKQAAKLKGNKKKP